jgi:hypothetical protein
MAQTAQLADCAGDANDLALPMRMTSLSIFIVRERRKNGGQALLVAVGARSVGVRSAFTGVCRSLPGRLELALASGPGLPARPIFTLSLLASRILRASRLLPACQSRSISARTDTPGATKLHFSEVLLPNGASDAFTAVCGSGRILWKASGATTISSK